MPRKCCVDYCNKSKSKNRHKVDNITFHMFPSEDNRKSMWIEQIKLGNNQTNVNDRGIVCCEHFNTTDFIKKRDRANLSKKRNKMLLKSSAVPIHFPTRSPSVLPIIPLLRTKKEDVQEDNIITTNGVAANFEFVDTSSPLINQNKKISYPGDIDASNDMSQNTVREHILLCQSKIKAQAMVLYRLKEKTRRQRVQIQNLKKLLKEKSIYPRMRETHSSNDTPNSDFKHSDMILLNNSITVVKQEEISEESSMEM